MNETIKNSMNETARTALRNLLKIELAACEALCVQYRTIRYEAGVAAKDPKREARESDYHGWDTGCFRSGQLEVALRAVRRIVASA